MISLAEMFPQRQTNSFHFGQYLYLPGVVDKSSFIELCEGCLECASACRHNAITWIESEPGVRYPFIEPKSSPCHMCVDMPCSQACHSGALTKIPQHKINMGTAMLDPLRCLCLNDEECQACVDACPLSGTALMWDEDIQAPLINMQECSGCGMCVHACPSLERPIMIVPY